MKWTLFCGICILLIQGVLAWGPIQTTTITPTTLQLCGQHQQFTSITASGIKNSGTQNLTNVIATLYVSGNSGLSFLTPQQINLGSIAAGQQIAATPSWTIQCNQPREGIYTAYVNYSSTSAAASSLGEAVSLISVHTAQPFFANISLIEGDSSMSDEAVLIADNTPTLTVFTSRNAVCKGSLDTDENYASMDFIFMGMQQYHNYTFLAPIAQGEHTVYVRCQDELGDVMQTSGVVKFFIDTQYPVITVIEPQGNIIGEFADITIEVSEEAQCRYSKGLKDFEDMQAFRLRTGNEYSASLPELDEKEYDYYVTCIDNVGNSATKLISFDVVLAPKARIEVSQSTSLAKGTYEVKLYTSKKLRETPQLSYGFTDEPGFSRIINLIDEGDYYLGYLIIDDEDKTRSGVFNFEGTDEEGIVGTQITKGGVFLVDTIAPGAPETVVGKEQEGEIELRWFYSGETPKTYNIYRSTTSGVGKIDLYDTTSAMVFYDDNIAKNQIYYYRVAAVDKSGNIGVLSKEISVYTTSGDATAQVVNSNPPTQQTRQWLTETKSSVESLLIDLDWSKNNLDDTAKEESAVSDLGLIKQVQDAATAIKQLQAQLNGINMETITDTLLRETLSKADAQIARTKKLTPQTLEIVKKTEQKQALSDQDIELAVNEWITTLDANYTENEIEDYIDQMHEVNKKVQVESTIKTITIKYLDQSTTTRVLVEKKYGYNDPDPLIDVIIIENIPKTVAGHVDSIDPRTPDYRVVNPDPVIAWFKDRLDTEKQTLRYIILADDVSEAAKTTKTTILVDPQDVIIPSRFITGFSIFMGRIKSTGMEIIGIVTGLLVVGVLLGYYVVVINGYELPKLASLSQKLPSLSFERFKSTQQQESIQVPQLQMDPLLVDPHKYFYTHNNDVVRSISELPSMLRQMDDFTFYYHVSHHHNDFADWVEMVMLNKELAKKIRSTNTKQNMLAILKAEGYI